MTDLTRERIAALRKRSTPVNMTPREFAALLDMAERALDFESALGADAPVKIGPGGAMERRPDWTQYVSSPTDEDRIKRALLEKKP